MVTIIPAINANNFGEVQQKIKEVEPFSDWVQIDVADGTFTKNTIWHNASDLLSLKTSLKIEVHLMLGNIDERIQDWLISQVDRIVFHLSASQDPDFVIAKCRDAGKEVGVVVAPEESLTRALAYGDRIDLIQILGVYPGLPGQKTLPKTFDRIKEARKFLKDAIIEVDGGMNLETAKKAVEAGANIIVSASNWKILYESYR